MPNSIKEYIANLNRLKKAALAQWTDLSEEEKQIFDASYDWLIDNLEIKRGKITIDEDLTRAMDEFLKAVQDIINNNKGYRSTVTDFLSDLSSIQRNNIDFHATTNNFNIDVAGVRDVQKVVVEEILDQYLKTGLNAHFVTPMRDGIFRNILAGANMKQVREVLRNDILGGKDKSGKLGQYLDQTAMMAVDSYEGAINVKLVETFTFTGYIIAGSLIETSSKQCVYAVETSEDGYLSFAEWERVLQIARDNPKATLKPGTTIKNLPLLKLHHGCRHSFIPIIMKPKNKK